MRVYLFTSRVHHRLCLRKSAWCSGPKRQLKAAGPSIQLNAVDRSPFRASVTLAPIYFGRKGNIMETPAILRGDSLKRLLQGAAVGALATLTIGFYWGGWVTGGHANEMVRRSSTAAVVTALSPICVDKFQHSAEASVNLAEFKKISTYQQSSFRSEERTSELQSRGLISY